MADFTVRSIGEIFNSLLEEKRNLTALDEATDGGVLDINTYITNLTETRVAEWLRWLHFFSVSTNFTEIAVQTAIDEIQNIIDNQIVFTAPWFIKVAKEFQNGDSLLINPETNKPYYETVNLANRIIESATVTHFPNKLLLKVKRLSSNILSPAELSSFTYYMSKIKPVGTRLEIANFNPDLITINMNVLYQGNLAASAIQGQVETAINNYLTNLSFDSKFNRNMLIDKVQAVVGVIDPRVVSISVINDIGQTDTIQDEYTSLAGYMSINPATPLSTTITYTPV